MSDLVERNKIRLESMSFARGDSVSAILRKNGGKEEGQDRRKWWSSAILVT